MKPTRFTPLLLTLCTSVTLGCCMVPANYKGTIGQDAQEAVLLHRDGHEDLVLRINYRITGDTMPERFAWVITVPAEPDEYALADPELFEDMFDLAERLLVPKPNFFSRMMPQAQVDSAAGGVELGQRVQVGPYDIQPVRGVGPNALEGLNNWLGENGFPAEDPKHMQYFVDHGFTFLCVRILPPKESREVGPGGMLSPLHLSFRSPTPYYPLLFSSRQGVFKVNLHMLSETKFDFKASAETLKRINWRGGNLKQNVRVKADDLPDTLQKVVAASADKKAPKRWYYNNFRCYRVNEGDAIQGWTEDVLFSVR